MQRLFKFLIVALATTFVFAVAAWPGTSTFKPELGAGAKLYLLPDPEGFLLPNTSIWDYGGSEQRGTLPPTDEQAGCPSDPRWQLTTLYDCRFMLRGVVRGKIRKSIDVMFEYVARHQSE